MTAAVRNDGEGTVSYVRPVALLSGKRYEHVAGGAMPLLGRERSTEFHWSLPVDGDPAAAGLSLEITYGRRGITGKRKRKTVSWGADSALLY